MEETSEVNSIILPGGYASVSKSNTVVAAVWQNSTCQNDENFNQAKILVLSYGITTHVFYWNTCGGNLAILLDTFARSLADLRYRVDALKM